MLLDDGAQSLQVALDHGCDQRLPVGKILIETADRDAGALGHPRGSEFAIPHHQQNLNARVEKRRHGCFRTGLNGPFSGLERMSRLCRHECEFPKPEGSFTLVVMWRGATLTSLPRRSCPAAGGGPPSDFACHPPGCMR